MTFASDLHMQKAAILAAIQRISFIKREERASPCVCLGRSWVKKAGLI